MTRSIGDAVRTLVCALLALAASTPIAHAAPADRLTDALLDRATRTNPTLAPLAVTLPDGSEETLSLRRFWILPPDAILCSATTSDPRRPAPFDPERVVLLRGQLDADPTTHAFLAIDRVTNAVTGRLELGPGRPTLALARRTRGAGPDEIRLGARHRSATGEAFGAMRCDCPDTGAPATGSTRGGFSGGVQEAGPIHHIELAVEADHEYRLLFESSDDTMVSLIALYGAMADIYIRDLRANVSISFLRIWEEPDLRFDSGSPHNDLRNYWQSNMEDVHRDSVQLISGRRNLPAGGTASGIGGVCTATQYSYFGYALGSFADPTRPSIFNRDISLAAHELGHVVGASHTHLLNIDRCDEANQPPARGPIMSYCGQSYTGGGANTDLRFHARSFQAVDARLRGSDCIGHDCNLNAIDDALEINDGARDTNGDGILDECQDCDADGVLDPVAIANDPSLDRNDNGRPDDCDSDCDADGAPDVYTPLTDLTGNWILDDCEADCDGNGRSDLTDIRLEMSRDLDRDAVLDECQDCDADGTPDVEQLALANSVWVADLGQNILRRYLWVTGTESGQSGTRPTELLLPQDVRVLRDGRVIVSSATDHRVVQYGRDGTPMGDLVGREDVPPEPTGMVITPEGELFVAGRADGSVRRYDALDGTPLGVLIAPGPDAPIRPFGVEIGPDDRLYVTSDDNSVRAYDRNTGAFLRTHVAPNADGLTDPRGLCFLPNGHLLVASRETNQVLRYDTDGTPRGQFNQNGTATRLTLDQPWCIRLGPDGGVYVSRSSVDPDPSDGGGGGTGLHLTNARIYHFDPGTGNFIRAFIQGLDSNLTYPSGFDFGPDAGIDCNGNLVIDRCEIDSGAERDRNNNGRPDACEPRACALDLDDNDTVSITDLLIFLDLWLQEATDAELTDDGAISILDLLAYVDAWLRGSALGLCAG